MARGASKTQSNSGVGGKRNSIYYRLNFTQNPSLHALNVTQFPRSFILVSSIDLIPYHTSNITSTYRKKKLEHTKKLI